MAHESHRITLLLVFFKFVGLATFSISNQSASKRKCTDDIVIFTRSKLGGLYNLLFSCLIIASNWLTIPILYSAEYAYKTTITTIIEIFQAILGTFVIFSILLYYSMNQSALVKIGNYFVHIAGTLRRLQQPLNCKHIFFVLFLVCLFQFVLFIGVFVTEYESFRVNPVSYLGTILPATFVAFLFIQYFFVLMLTDAIFVNINRIIQDLYRSRFSDAFSNTVHQKRPFFVSCLTIQRLLQIRDIHDHLCDISNEVSRFYSLPSLIGLSSTFFTLLYNTYYFFSSLLEDMTMNFMILMNMLFWILLMLHPLGLLTSKVTKIVNEIDKTGNFVHKLLNRTIDRETKGELQLFSLQLLHRKVEFTANGYFTLDNTLFQSMLSTVTTYMVILMQFQMGSSDENDLSCNRTH